MFDNIVCIITIVLALAILILGVIFLIQEARDLDCNNGKCEVCGENVIPVARHYTTDYYCVQCGRYNIGKAVD